MAILLRPSNDRGREDHGWLDTRHTFSFADYHDPAQMGFRSLRVINEDVVRPGAGFPTHGHRDMEILSYVIAGALEHRDSTGTHGVIRRGDVQRMSAGTGVRHSEFNASASEPVHFLQIWILPARAGLAPGYEQAAIDDDARRDRWFLMAAPDGGAVKVHQDARVYASLLGGGKRLRHELGTGRGAWLQVVAGELTLGGRKLQAGDGAAVESETGLEIEAVRDSELLLFDLA